MRNRSLATVAALATFALWPWAGPLRKRKGPASGCSISTSGTSLGAPGPRGLLDPSLRT